MYNESMTYYPSSYYVDIPRSYIGLVGRATYDWNTRYMLDVNIGYNGSENFALASVSVCSPLFLQVGLFLKKNSCSL